MNNTTLLLVIDNQHLDELKVAWKNWNYFKPEITNLPVFLVYDKEIENRLTEIPEIAKKATLYPFTNKQYYASQRDAMLTSFFEGIRNIKTKHYLKVDTDCLAHNHDKGWLKQMDIADDVVFVSKGWGYTKPAAKIYALEDWADKTLSQYPRLNLKPVEGSDLIKHKRIISWIFLGKTDWTNSMSGLCWKNDHYELPLPSQDTFTWYCAERTKAKYIRTNFKEYGFDHGRIRKLVDSIGDKTWL
jgi:hypothetical protein